MNHVNKHSRRKSFQQSEFKPFSETETYCYGTKHSLLTELFEDKRVVVVYHVAATVTLGCIINSILLYLLTDIGTLMGFRLLITAFGKFHVAAFAWIIIFFATNLVFVLFKLWNRLHHHYKNKFVRRKLCDIFFTLLTAFYLLSSLVFMFEVSTVYILPPLSAFFLLTDGIRLLMKAYAFLRTNVPKQLQHKQNDLKFSRYFYFLFAPTLVYKENYLRTASISYTFVIKCVAEIVSCFLLWSFIWDSYLILLVKDVCIQNFTFNQMLLTCTGAIPAGLACITLFNFCYLHSLQNLFAEILRFGDRTFYKDWWNSTGFKTFHRTWNVLVYDWVQSYIYKDVKDYFLRGWKFGAQVVVLFFSSALHELVLICATKSFTPVFFTLFFTTAFLLDFKEPKHFIGHLLFLYVFGLACGMFCCLYTMEFFAAFNISLGKHSAVNYLIPRCLSCL